MGYFVTVILALICLLWGASPGLTESPVKVICSLEIECVSNNAGQTCKVTRPATTVLVEIDTEKKVWTELWTYQDSTISVSSGPMVHIDDDEFVLYDGPDKVYGRPERERISRRAGTYDARVPSNAGNDIAYRGSCVPTDQSIPAKKF